MSFETERAPTGNPPSGGRGRSFEVIESELGELNWIESRLGNEFTTLENIQSFAESIDGPNYPLRLVGTTLDEFCYFNADGELQIESNDTENVLNVLQKIKETDPEGLHDSYDLRRELLRKSKGRMATADAYTLGDISQLGRNQIREYLNNPESWVSRRQLIHDNILSNAIEQGLQFAEREKENPTLYLLRGNTAAGKTTSMRSDLMFAHLLEDDPDLHGAINPDVIKEQIKETTLEFGRETVNHYQAHLEGSMLTRKVVEVLSDLEGSMLIDKRLDERSDLVDCENLADKKNCTISMLDVDCPLEVSLIRVLDRTPGGESPLVPFAAVAEGYVQIKKNRQWIIDTFINNDIVEHYELVTQDEMGNRNVIVKKDSGQIEISDPLGLEDAISSESEVEVENLRQTVIDQDYIRLLERRMSLTGQQVENLHNYKGKTFEEALNAHALLIAPPEIISDEYINLALRNLSITSRTAQGVIDTSASADKKDKVEQLGASEAKNIAIENFTKAIDILYQNKDSVFQGPNELAKFIEKIALTVNEGILREGELFRDGIDSTKYPYSPVAELPLRWKRFCRELFLCLSDPNEDPIKLAAWIEYKVDLSEHFFADGCGKVAKAISSWVLMKANLPLADYSRGGKVESSEVRSEYYSNAPKEQVGNNRILEAEQLKVWHKYYSSLF